MILTVSSKLGAGPDESEHMARMFMSPTFLDMVLTRKTLLPLETEGNLGRRGEERGQRDLDSKPLTVKRQVAAIDAIAKIFCRIRFTNQKAYYPQTIELKFTQSSSLSFWELRSGKQEIILF